MPILLHATPYTTVKYLMYKANKHSTTLCVPGKKMTQKSDPKQQSMFWF